MTLPPSSTSPRGLACQAAALTRLLSLPSPVYLGSGPARSVFLQSRRPSGLCVGVGRGKGGWPVAAASDCSWSAVPATRGSSETPWRASHLQLWAGPQVGPIVARSQKAHQHKPATTVSPDSPAGVQFLWLCPLKEFKFCSHPRSALCL